MLLQRWHALLSFGRLTCGSLIYLPAFLCIHLHKISILNLCFVSPTTFVVIRLFWYILTTFTKQVILSMYSSVEISLQQKHHLAPNNMVVSYELLNVSNRAELHVVFLVVPLRLMKKAAYRWLS